MSAPPPPPPAGPETPWQRVRTLFDAALELSGEAREALLADPAHPAEVVAEVRSLLAFEDEPSQLDRTPSLAALDHAGDEDPADRSPGRGATVGASIGPSSARPSAPPEERQGQRLGERLGQRLGAWRISGFLGSGGMGEVWAAERDDGRYNGQAAIKLLKRGMDSQAVLARFAHEQQALARLSHPHIARLLDAGLSPDGLPYFVMELAPGRPIDQACAGLALEARLALFLQLAEAVAHAHRHLLVHRDLKPGNVLVSDDGQVKLLDFGIAKALTPSDGPASDAGMTPAQALTQQGQRPYTPLYASPEQVRGEPVSTATDIYSLGVLLYGMLTGERPYGRQASSAAEASRAVLEEEPTRPSSLARPAPGWEAERRRLQGDLDNILLKALEKPVHRRYASVDAMAADVRAFLGGFPVSARPASAAYVLGKFVRRHRWAVLAGTLGGLGLATGLAAAWLSGRWAAALGVLGLATGTGLALLQARQAALARDEAARARDAAQHRLGEVKRITTDLVFRYGDSVTLLPGGAAEQENLLKDLVASLEPALQAAPDDSELMATLAAALGRLGEIQGNTVTAAPERAPEAAGTVARALALGERAWSQHKHDMRFAQWHIRARTVQAQTLRDQGRLEDAEQALLRAIDDARSSLAVQRDALGRAFLSSAVATQQLTLGQLYEHANLPCLNRPQEALAQLRGAEQTYREMLAQADLLRAIDATGPAGSPSAEGYLLHQLGTVLGARALIQLRQDQLPALREEAEAAMLIRRRNVEREPAVVPWRDGLMTEANTLSIARLRTGDAPGALEAALLARDTALALARDEGPQSKWAGVQPFLAPQLAGAWIATGEPALALGVIEPALTTLRARGTTDEATQRRITALEDLQRQAEAALRA